MPQAQGFPATTAHAATVPLCKMCGVVSEPWDTAVILRKYRVRYFRCESCGFIQTEEPYWMEQAYSEAISETDIGLVSRNVTAAGTTRRIIHLLFDHEGEFLDYGGGYGMLARLMRDAGYNFYRSDKYCPNLFAKGFDETDRTAPERPFELVTAYEVVEHLSQPLETFEKMLQRGKSILFSTCLVPFSKPPKPHEWWYYGLDSGQHISLYTHFSLSGMAKKLGLAFYSHGSLHLLSEKRLNPALFSWLSSARIGRLSDAFLPKKQSLLPADHERICRRDSR